MPAEHRVDPGLLPDERELGPQPHGKVNSSASAGTVQPPHNGTSIADSVPGSPQKPLQNLLKRLLPSTIWSGLRVTAELKPVSSSTYRRVRAVARAWRRAGQKPVFQRRIDSVVFVCHGNIMRSPVAEAMFRNELKKRSIANVSVASAGMHAVNGRSADLRAQKVAPEFGVTVNQHQAQLLSQNLVDAYDLVIVMDIQNAAEFLIRHPRAGGKLFMLRQFSQRSRGAGLDIPDPYPGDEDYMRQCCGMLRECIAALADEFNDRQQPSF